MNAESRPGRSSLALWFGLLGGHVAWTTQLLSSYALVEAVCPGGDAKLAMGAVTLAAGLVALASGWAAWRVRRRGRGFLGTVGLLLAGIYLYLIALGGVGLAAFGTCEYQ